MNAEFDKYGKLKFTAESELESAALVNWLRALELSLQESWRIERFTEYNPLHNCGWDSDQ